MRDGTYGLGRVVLRKDEQAILIPSEALHWTGESHVVFVRDRRFEEKGAPKVFHVRAVRPGARQEETTEILVGLYPGEVIAGMRYENPGVMVRSPLRHAGSLSAAGATCQSRFALPPAHAAATDCQAT